VFDAWAQDNKILIPFDDGMSGLQLKREIAKHYHDLPVSKQTLMVGRKQIADAPLLSAQGLKVRCLYDCCLVESI
jgi:hypothetical protein